MDRNTYRDACAALEMPLDNEKRLGSEAIDRARSAMSLAASYSVDDMRALVHATRIITQMGALMLAFGESERGIQAMEAAQVTKSLVVAMAAAKGLIEDLS